MAHQNRGTNTRWNNAAVRELACSPALYTPRSGLWLTFFSDFYFSATQCKKTEMY
jgi:hypothetical protein